MVSLTVSFDFCNFYIINIPLQFIKRPDGWLKEPIFEINSQKKFFYSPIGSSGVKNRVIGNKIRSEIARRMVKKVNYQKMFNKKILFFRRLPILLSAIFGGSPRISFAFSLTHWLTDSLTHWLIGSYLFQKGRVFHRFFGFLLLKYS